MLVRGKVLRFDEVRGYGFIAPDDGTDDVFMHANDLRDDERQIRPGVIVEFGVEEGDRGPKASAVRVLGRSDVVSVPPVSTVQASGVTGPHRPLAAEADDGMCDVLTSLEFRHEITELLIESARELTAAQIGVVRDRLADFAKAHGWVES
jgi:cold shock CspA family protein